MTEEIVHLWRHSLLAENRWSTTIEASLFRVDQEASTILNLLIRNGKLSGSGGSAATDLYYT